MKVSEEDLNIIRQYIIEHVMRNPEVLFSEDCRNDKADLVDIIASLYEILHRTVTGETYQYMWHWANKCGSSCDDSLFERILFENEHK